MTGAVGAIAGGFPTVLRFTSSIGGSAMSAISTVSRTNPRSFTMGTFIVALSGHFTYTADAFSSNGMGGDDGVALFWLQDGAASNYECRAVPISGTPTTGTMNTWLALTSDRAWTKTSDASAVTFTIEVGLAGTSTAIISATVTL